MKKILLSVLSALLLSACGICASLNTEVLTLFSQNSIAQNKIWVGTFQLVFNDMKNNIIKKDVRFNGIRMTKELKGLNNEEFNSSMLDENSYYKSYGETSPEASDMIKKAIWDKFQETSDILDKLDWTKKFGSYYAYAMLKKEFKFPNEFDILEDAPFNSSSEKYKYFGIQDSSKSSLDDNVKVLFYEDENNYAIRLLTTEGDIVYLYRTDDNSNFKKLFEKMNKNKEKFKGDKNFLSSDTLKVPNLKIREEKRYPQLCNKTIKGTNFYFSEAIETIQLDLDNKGGKVKSEAALMMKCLAMPIEIKKQPRHFNFDKTFVMFLIDKDKTDPYLAIRVNNLKELNK